MLQLIDFRAGRLVGNWTIDFRRCLVTNLSSERSLPGIVSPAGLFRSLLAAARREAWLTGSTCSVARPCRVRLLRSSWHSSVVRGQGWGRHGSRLSGRIRHYFPAVRSLQ